MEAAEFYRELHALRARNVMLARLDEARRDTNGGSIAVPTAWPEFMPSTDVNTSLLDWRHTALLAEGFIDE